MPNWCYTDYTFIGNENEIKDFCNKIKSFTSKERIPNNFGNFWLGNVVDGFSFDYNEIDCRGEVLSVSEITKHLSECKFSVNIMTAWKPFNQMWKKIVEKYYPSIKYVFIAEEAGNEIFINTDVEGSIYSDRFCMELSVPEKYECESTYYFSSEKDITETLNSIFGYSYDNYEQCVKAVQEELEKEEYCNKEYYILVHKYATTYENE